MNAYAERLGHLAPEQLQAALDRFDLGRLVSTTPVTTGNFGQNVFLTASTGEYVFRGNPLRDYQFAKERYVAHVLHERTSVPVPWPYHHEPDRDLFGWEYAIMARLDGVQLAEPDTYDSLTGDDRMGIAVAMARTLADLQSATNLFAGTYDLRSRSIVPFDHGYREWVEQLIQENLAQALDLTKNDRDWVGHRIQAARPAMEKVFTPCFVHCDFHTNNVVAEQRDDTWRITGVFDLMSSHFGNGEFDLARQFTAYAEKNVDLARAFLDTWCREMGDRPGRRDRLLLFILNERLNIWEWAKRTRRTWWPDSMSFREWVEGFTALLPDTV